ncbi:MAG: hypothetical protein Q9222_002038 [Ikaeria aurantiellina]
MGDNVIIIILGASGNLAAKKLYRRGVLSEKLKVVGFDPTHLSHDDFIERIKSSVREYSSESGKSCEAFCKRCSYITINQDGGDESFLELRKSMESFIEDNEPQNRYFYMAVPPGIYTSVSEQLRRNCYPEKGDSQIIVCITVLRQDLESSIELHKQLAPHWKENEMFRIDHYLGKEMVKNLMTLRFGNPIFGALWDCSHIDHVQISMTEAIGTEGRGGYFDDVGIIRDVMQNHLIQLMALTAMERPGSFSAEDLRHEKIRVLRLVPPLDIRNTITGQFVKSTDGKNPGYKDDESVPQDSNCATFCTSVAYVKNARWEGVPFLLKSGKALNESKTEIRIQLKDTTDAMLKDTSHNQLVIRIQPDEAVRLKMNAKAPGYELRTVGTELDLTYQRTVEDPDIPEAYESLLLAALKGDYSDSVSEQELEASWKIFTPLLHQMEGDKGFKPLEYPYDSEGPEGLEDFVKSYQFRA